MATLYQVTCIRKRDRQNPHERIQSIGGAAGNGRWELPEADAIAGMEDGRWQFYVNVNAQRIFVVVALHQGRKYLKTQADGYEPNNLLRLPECP